MNELLANHASALFALFGTLAGAGLSFVSTWILKKRELKLRLTGKVLDRRIEAHERITLLVQPMRTTVYFGYDESEHEVARTPGILSSPEQFNQWYTRHYLSIAQSMTWLTSEVRRELNLFQDYIVNLMRVLEHADDDDYPEIGQLIRNDFIIFAGKIEALAVRFFEKGLANLELSDVQKEHKYPRQEAEQRLYETELFKKGEQINSIVGHKVI